MIDYGMMGWHFIGFVLVVTAVMMAAKKVLPDLQGGSRFGLLCLVVACAWYAHANYYIQSGTFLRDTLLAPVLGKRPPAERLSYSMEAKAWKNPNIRKELKLVSVLDRSKKALDLANAGIFRLSDAQLMRWLEISTHLFEEGHDSECSAMIKGSIPLETIFGMLNRLSESELREYFELVIEALAIGATPDLPAPQPVGDTTAIMRDIMNTLQPDEQKRFVVTATTLNIGSGKDSCWFGKTVFAGITTLSPESRVALLQSLTTKQPSAAPIQARRF